VGGEAVCYDGETDDGSTENSNGQEGREQQDKTFPNTGTDHENMLKQKEMRSPISYVCLCKFPHALSSALTPGLGSDVTSNMHRCPTFAILTRFILVLGRTRMCGEMFASIVHGIWLMVRKTHVRDRMPPYLQAILATSDHRDSRAVSLYCPL
jgi:hypothetical protein